MALHARPQHRLSHHRSPGPRPLPDPSVRAGDVVRRAPTCAFSPPKRPLATARCAAKHSTYTAAASWERAHRARPRPWQLSRPGVRSFRANTPDRPRPFTRLRVRLQIQLSCQCSHRRLQSCSISPDLAALRPVVTDMCFPCQRLTVGVPAGGFPVPEPHTSLALASTVRLLGGLCALDAFPFGRTVVIEEPPQRLRNHGPGPEPRLGTAVRNGRAHFSASLIHENTPSSELAGPVRLLQLSPCPDITAPSAPVLLAACRY